MRAKQVDRHSDRSRVEVDSRGWRRASPHFLFMFDIAESAPNNSPMIFSGKSFFAHRLDVVKFSFICVIAALFMVSASLVGGQTVQTICSFSMTNGEEPNGLTLGNDGNFYGTAPYGGSGARGTVFRVTTNGTLTTLVSFSGTNGENAYAPLTLGSDGNFYGTTMPGGPATVFRVTTNGTLTTLYMFTNYAFPGGVTLGNDGNLYGTEEDGTTACETLFKVTTNGTFTSLYAVTNGWSPNGLTMGNGGNFYGTSSTTGVTNSAFPQGMGTVFQVAANGTLTTLYSFTNGMDGANPGLLTLGNDGNFYGTTCYGGITNSTYPRGLGTAFQVTSTGTLTTLFSLNSTNPWVGGAVLNLANDGNFYCTTPFGGITNSTYNNSSYWTQGMGTVLQVRPNGMVTILCSFDWTNGASPNGLTLGYYGHFYGTTEYAGSGGEGTVFRLDLTPTLTVQPQGQTNNAGATVTFTCATILQTVDFQWQKNGTNLVNAGNISGATNSALTIDSISDSDAGTYSVVVTDAEGTVSSSNAVLRVIDSPAITTQPVGQSILRGGSVAFTLTATGTPPLQYQWRFNSANIANATNASYAIPVVGTNNTGNYCVIVTNSAASVTSSNALLTVLVPPSLSLELSGGYPVLSLYASLGTNYMLQYSSNLAATNWLNLLSITNLSDSPYLFLDPSGVSQPERFYRALFTQ